MSDPFSSTKKSATSATVVSIVLAEEANSELDAIRRAIEALPAVSVAQFLRPESKNPRLRRLLHVYLAPGAEPDASLESIRAVPGVASAELPAERHLLTR